MRRYRFVLAATTLALPLFAGGCRSCSTCHDYDPPVAGCECNAYGTHRAGSASGGYVGGYVAGPLAPQDAAAPPARTPSN